MSGTRRLLWESRTPFNEIRVVERADGVRELLSGHEGVVQSEGVPGRPLRLPLRYARGVAAALGFVPEARRVLVLGLGGGTLPMLFRAILRDVAVDVAELDPAMLEAAKRFFGLREGPGLRVHLGDARAFLARTGLRFDAIVLDAYARDRIPRHLATVEFLELVARRLAPGGVVLGNVWGEFTNRAYRPILRTYREVFPALAVLRIPRCGNRIFVAAPQAGRLRAGPAVRAAAALGGRSGLKYDLGGLLRDGLVPAPSHLPGAPWRDAAEPARAESLTATGRAGAGGRSSPSPRPTAPPRRRRAPSRSRA